MAATENGVDSGNRYAHDMEQAEAMRGSSRSRLDSSQPSSASSSSRKQQLTSRDVEMALRGLDEADELRESGVDREKSLRLYELSLELLILYLKDEENQRRIPEVDASTVAARLGVALSDAEELKATLPKRKPGEIQAMFGGGLFSALSDALVGRGKKAAPAVAKISGAAPSTAKTLPTRKLPVKRTTRQRPAAPDLSKVNAAQSGSPSSKGTATSTDKSQIHQAVLDDLLVNPESVQETSWDDIAGLEEVKQSLQESAILPLVRPDLFTGLRRPQNVLLWGPPGTGKTMLVRAVAMESGSSLFACSASSLTSKWMGEAEKLVKTLFQVARELSPSLVFLDEVDALLSSRKSDGEHEASRRLKTEFMVQMEGITSGKDHVLVLACTNCPWDVDSAVLRRFPRRIFVPMADTAARSALLQKMLKKAGKHSIKKKQRDDLVRRLEGFSCSDIAAIASEASFGPIRSLGGLTAVRGARAKDVRPINGDDFENAIDKATRSVSRTQLEKFETWLREQSAA